MTTKEKLESIVSKEAGDTTAAKVKMPQSDLKSGGKKAAAFGASAVGLGAYDALHPTSWNSYFIKAGQWLGKYMPRALQFLLPIPTQFYQVALIGGSVGAGAGILYNKNWSKKRNLSNLITVPANAVTADYTSATIAAKKPLYPLPKADYGWRIPAFKHTLWGGLAHLINSPSFIPGILTGYVLGMASLGVYFAVQGGYLLYKNYAKVKAWVGRVGARVSDGIDRFLASVKEKASRGYTYLADKLKNGYMHLAEKTKGFAHRIISEMPSLNPIPLHPQYVSALFNA